MDIALAWRLAKWGGLLLAVVAIWMHGHHYGVESTTQRYEYARAQDAKAASDALREAEAAARVHEQETLAAWSAAADIQHEELTHVQAHRDRLLADIRAGRLRLPSACPAHLPEAPADSATAQDGAESGQPGLAGEELVARLSTCDEVTVERNLAVELLKSERR